MFLVAVFATPAFGFLLDRIGRNALMLSAGAALLPLSFLVLAVWSAGGGLSTALLGAQLLVPAGGAVADACRVTRRPNTSAPPTA